MAVLAIGNELLSGKVRDENLYWLAGELRDLGVELRLAVVVPDDVDAIVEALAWARARADVVLTSGGVGPTHDDITLRALAAAFDRGLVRHAGLARAIEDYYGEATEDLLSMADMPRDAELLQPAPFFLPIVRVEDVYAFPGDPQALRLLFGAWKEALREEPYHLARLFLDADEGRIAPLLREVQEAAPGLDVGSYPRFDPGAPYRVLVTLEGKDTALVETAAVTLRERLERELGGEAILGSEAPPADEVPR